MGLDARGWPSEVSINAWADTSVTGGLDSDARSWILGQDVETKAKEAHQSLPTRRRELRDWTHEEVGWGVILPTSGLSTEEEARLIDAPAGIRRLAEARAGPEGPVVLRYAPGDGGSSLQRVYRDRAPQDVAITGSIPGTGHGQLPAYLLLVGSPSRLPWDLQFRLNLSSSVGRLDLPDDALERYVDALLDDWSNAQVDATRPVVWATDYDHITTLMRDAIAEPVARRFQQDPLIGDRASYLVDHRATATALARTLAENRPGVVVTTSHGRTGPLGDAAAMKRNLGLLVDVDHDLVETDALLAGWQPDGVVWYAHACCSAGSYATTRYTGLVEDGSLVARTLDAVAALGSLVAPLPMALLSAEKPARAFVGHVEPTFDWTLERLETQPAIAAIIEALYDGFFQPQPKPVGLAFRRHFAQAVALFNQSFQAIRKGRESSEEWQMASSLALLKAYDRQSVVVLGDPTVSPVSLPLEY